MDARGRFSRHVTVVANGLDLVGNDLVVEADFLYLTARWEEHGGTHRQRSIRAVIQVERIFSQCVSVGGVAVGGQLVDVDEAQPVTEARAQE